MGYKASVIIPVYNAEKTIRRCVESLVFGEERNIEIILVDDCSKDNSWAVCSQLQSEYKNVSVFRNEKNSGVSYTRNQGLKEAEAEYVLFMDSDDWGSRYYVSQLLLAAVENPKYLVMCGFFFWDNIHNTRTRYIWGENNPPQLIVPKTQYFKLIDKIFIQFVWNKVFRLDVIRSHNIHFDESKSMGEDFQFVLDYMKATAPESCLILNRPLYYYIRANNTSLMSKMGLTGFEYSLDRLSQLAQFAGMSDSTEYREQIEKLKTNYIYQIVHDKKSNKAEKLKNIEAVTGGKKPEQYYKKQKQIVFKESLYGIKVTVNSLKDRGVGKFQREKRDRLAHKMAAKLETENVTIISQNCIGGVFYHDMGMKFQSPTIDLFFEARAFVKFVLHLKEYLNMEMVMRWEETYPIGILGDVEIHFMHYHSCSEAYEVWKRRKKRINFDRIVILSTDRNGFTEEVYSQWEKISYPKVLFTAQEQFAEDPDSIYYPEYKDDGFVPDLIPKREFYRTGKLIKTINKLDGGKSGD